MNTAMSSASALNAPLVLLRRLTFLSGAGPCLALAAAAAAPPGPTALPVAAATNALREVRCTVILQTRPDRLYCYATNKPFRVILREPAPFAHGEVFVAKGELALTNQVE